MNVSKFARLSVFELFSLATSAKKDGGFARVHADDGQGSVAMSESLLTILAHHKKYVEEFTATPGGVPWPAALQALAEQARDAVVTAPLVTSLVLEELVKVARQNGGFTFLNMEVKSTYPDPVTKHLVNWASPISVYFSVADLEAIVIKRRKLEADPSLMLNAAAPMLARTP